LGKALETKPEGPCAYRRKSALKRSLTTRVGGGVPLNIHRSIHGEPEKQRRGKGIEKNNAEISLYNGLKGRSSEM